MPTKTYDMQAVEERFGEPLETLIPRLYRATRSYPTIARTFGISRQTLHVWRMRLGLTDAKEPVNT